MSFNDNVRLDTSQVRTGDSGGSFGGGGGGGRGRGGVVAGGGIGGLLLLLLTLFFGGQAITDDQGDSSQGTSVSDQQLQDKCRSGADANNDDDCLVVATVNSVQAYWSGVFRAAGRTYTPAPTYLYNTSRSSPCGLASNDVGPFYCPLDNSVYLSTGFYGVLSDQFGSSTGNLAKEYVIAHEYGHHIQEQLGLLARAQQDPRGPQSGSVRTELMADCLAGVWAKNASSTADADGTPYLKGVTQQDLLDALSAAKSVGDDNIQQTMGSGQVNPESWTHGSSQARQRWFLQGYQAGNINSCDTFSVDNVE